MPILTTESEYLNLVKVYLSQELPEIFKSILTVTDEYIWATLPDDVVFDKGYTKLKLLIEESVERIRQEEYDLNFTI